MCFEVSSYDLIEINLHGSTGGGGSTIIGGGSTISGGGSTAIGGSTGSIALDMTTMHKKVKRLNNDFIFLAYYSEEIIDTTKNLHDMDRL